MIRQFVSSLAGVVTMLATLLVLSIATLVIRSLGGDPPPLELSEITPPAIAENLPESSLEDPAPIARDEIAEPEEPAPPPPPAVEIVSGPDVKITRADSVYVYVSWKAEILNRTDRLQTRTLRILVLDSDRFTIDQRPRLLKLKPGRNEILGEIDVPIGLRDQIASVRLEIL